MDKFIGKVCVMKLISGEEIVAKRVNKGDTGWIWSKPRVFQIIQQGTQTGVALIPWFVSDPECEVEITSMAIVAIIEATSAVESAYLKNTSSLDLSAAS